MPTIRSAHDIEEQPDLPAPRAGNGRSAYCYLFEDLASEPAAGIFSGSDEPQTFQRLQDFEVATRPPFDLPPAILTGLPAAYTYFGQFMNHDISAPVETARTPVGIIGARNRAGLEANVRADTQGILQGLSNEHPEPLNLCSLYGLATGDEGRDAEVAALYQPDGMRFRLGVTCAEDPAALPAGIVPIRAIGAPDLPRQDGEAQIADRRNDSNLILSQLHLAFMLVHNKAVKVLAPHNPAPQDCFRAARALVTLHYHWLILNDFLPRILSTAVDPGGAPRLQIAPGAVPLEFTTAAFRFGHSMVGQAYDFNGNFGAGGRISDEGATLLDLLLFTSRSGMGRDGGPPRQLPDHWVIEWDRLTGGAAAPAGTPPRTAERIDLAFALDMLNSAGNATIPGNGGSIMFRNLLRGFHRRMPFGQRLAQACGEIPLSPDEVRAVMLGTVSASPDRFALAGVAEALGLLHETPAWLYFLCEAMVREGGARVGPTASRIIAETILSLMRANPGSVLSHDGGTWHPRQSPLLGADAAPLVTLRDFLLFATAGDGRA